MDITNAIPLALDMKTGHFSRKGQTTSRILHWPLFYLAVLKVLHILYALVRLLIDFRPESFPTLILTFLWLSLCATSVYWGSELFHRGVEETITLFNSLEYAPSASFQLENQAQRQGWQRIKLVLFLAKNKVRILLSLSVQELLLVAMPFAVKLFVPLYILMMMAFPHWDIFTTSFMYGESGWTWGTSPFVAFEIVTGFYTETNILFFFFFNLALQVTHLVKLEIDIDQMK